MTPETRTQRRLAAILAADVAGYSRMMGANEVATLAALRDVWTLRFNPAVAAHRGRVVKMMGDGALVEFASAVDAVDCAKAIQQAMAGHNADRENGEPIELRIGINLGDIVIEGEDIFGDGVNVAARLESQAPRCGILVSDAVHAQVAGKVSVSFADAGELTLKNIASPVRAWRWEGEQVAPAPVVILAEQDDLPSIAVLPFDNMSNDPEQEYFSDGISEDIITDLSKIAGLMVVARNSSFAYKGRTKDIRIVGRELGVASVLEGSIRRAGNRVRITAQLIDARTGGHLWADRYDREMTDIFEVQDDVTLQIVGALKVQLKPTERVLLTQPAPDVASHDFVLKAREISNDLLRSEGDNRANVERIIGLLREAIASDPDYAQPYAYMAKVYTLEFSNGWLGSPDPLKQAADFAAMALEKDPNEPLAHNAMAISKMFTGDLAGAKAYAKQALTLNPNFAGAYGTLGNIHTYLGHPELAIPLLERAIRLDPMSEQMFTHFLGIAQLFMGQTELAAETFRRRIAFAPHTDRSRALLASTLGHLGRVDEAKAVWAELLAINPEYRLDDHLKRLPFRREEDRAMLAAGIAKAGIED